jgi:hypothetical protein
MVINYIQQSGTQYVHVQYIVKHNYGAIPLLFASPFGLSLAYLPFPFTYLETLLDVIESRPPWSQVARKLISLFPSLPHPLPIPKSRPPGVFLS